MKHPAQHDARIARALAVLALTLPAATGLSLAQDTPSPATTPATSPTRVVGEQVGTAREVIPFGAAAEYSDVIAFAVGQTRGPTPEPPSTPTTPKRVFPERDRTPESVVDDDDIAVEREQLDTTPGPSTPDPADPDPVEPEIPEAPTPEPSTPPVNVLLVGTADDPDAPTAWRRAAPPLDATGDPLAPGAWRPAGAPVVRASPPAAADESQRAAVASPHAGEATPSGAAALLVRLNRATPESGVLARRDDGRFQLLPGVPAELVAPAAQLANPDAVTDLAPLAVVDAQARPATPEPTTPTDPQSPARGKTGVLVIPPGGDGVLHWDGARWTEEPFQDAAGRPSAPARTPVALAATPDGDGVALVAAPDGTGAERITLYRRLADRSGWRPMTIDAPLLSGPLPGDIVSVKPTERPGDPLTVAPGHWWVDVLVRRAGASDDVAATVHLVPGPATAAVGDGAPAPTSPASTDPASTDPGPTNPGTTPPATSPDPASPATTPDDAPSHPLAARATATFCVAADPTADATEALGNSDGGASSPTKLCTGELPGGFPTGRGYRSQAFATAGAVASGAASTTPMASQPFGARVITSPVVEPGAIGRAGASNQAARDASASGGYLRLQGARFTLKGGLGETDQATGRTEAAAFLSDQVGWTGGTRLVARVMSRAAARAGTYSATTPPSWDPAIDVALSPPSVPIDERGAIVLGHSSIRREFSNRSPATTDYSTQYRIIDDRRQAVRAIAWLQRDRVAIVGSYGLFTTSAAPPTDEDGLLFSMTDPDGPVDRVSVAEGLDLTDIAVTFESDRPIGWAVGRRGAAIRVVGGDYQRIELPAPLAQADLRQVAYGGSQAYVASSVGPLVEQDGTLAIDQDLAAMIEADGRPPQVSTVAGLPDGAVIFDARYVRNGPESPWERLPSPAEGDVVATSLSRPGGDPAQGTDSLRVYAAIADRARPRIGEVEVSDDYSGAVPVKRSFERTPVAADGRLTELTPAGWVDRTRTPLERGFHADLAEPAVPIQSIATGPGGVGWAVGGYGGDPNGDNGRPLREPRSGMVRIDQDDISGPEVLPSTPAAARRAQAPAPTDPPAATTAPEQTSPEAAAAFPAGTPESKPIKILIGGHPACVETCTGREDQHVAPLANLRLALDASARLRARGEADAVVIGGGRGHTGGTALSRAGAQAYADLLRGDPATPPVFPALGSGDADTGEERDTFIQHVISPLRPRAAGNARAGEPQLVEVDSADSSDQALESPGAAYAFDVPGATGGAARVVVVDNAVGGALEGGADGPQQRWLARVLEDAQQQRRAVIVVGAAPLDRPTNLDGAQTLLELLVEHDVAAYVSTDGSDDPSSPEFGPRERIRTIDTRAGELTLIHTSGLSHGLPSPLLAELSRSSGDDERDEAIKDYVDGAAMVELTVPAVAQGRSVDAASIPLHRSMAPREWGDMVVGAAWPLFVLANTATENGVRWTDPNNKSAGRQMTAGDGAADATPLQCRLWFSRSDCGERLDVAGRYEVDDPSVAIFVQGRINRKTGEPEIITNGAGQPVQDSRSAVFCPLKAGTTWVSLTVAAQTVRWRVQVVEPPKGFPIPAGRKKCEFPWTGSEPPPLAPQPKPTVPAIPSPVLVPTAPILEPGTPTDPSKPSPTAPPVTRPLLLVPPLASLPTLAPPQAVPPVAPNPKPIQPPAPPAPPSGVTTQQVPSHSYGQVASPATQVQVVGVQQAERRTEVAREGVDHQATIYEAEPRTTIPMLLAGGALAILVAGAGHLAGRRRALARAAARRFLR